MGILSGANKENFLIFHRSQAKELSWSGGVRAGLMVSFSKELWFWRAPLQGEGPVLAGTSLGWTLPWSMSFGEVVKRGCAQTGRAEGISTNKCPPLKSTSLKGPVFFPQNIMQQWPWTSRTWRLSQNWSWNAKGFLSPMKRVQDNVGRSNILKKYIFYCSNQKTAWNDNSTVVLLGHYFLYFVNIWFSKKKEKYNLFVGRIKTHFYETVHSLSTIYGF